MLLATLNLSVTLQVPCWSKPLVFIVATVVTCMPGMHYEQKWFQKRQKLKSKLFIPRVIFLKILSCFENSKAYTEYYRVRQQSRYLCLFGKFWKIFCLLWISIDKNCLMSWSHWTIGRRTYGNWTWFKEEETINWEKLCAHDRVSSIHSRQSQKLQYIVCLKGKTSIHFDFPFSNQVVWFHPSRCLLHYLIIFKLLK